MAINTEFFLLHNTNYSTVQYGDSPCIECTVEWQIQSLYLLHSFSCIIIQIAFYPSFSNLIQNIRGRGRYVGVGVCSGNQFKRKAQLLLCKFRTIKILNVLRHLNTLIEPTWKYHREISNRVDTVGDESDNVPVRLSRPCLTMKTRTLCQFENIIPSL